MILIITLTLGFASTNNCEKFPDCLVLIVNAVLVFSMDLVGVDLIL